MRDFDWYILSSLRKTNNITKSAEQLFLTQSALTKRLQVIERELGCPLVIRSQKGITFTPEGERVVQKAETIIHAIQDIKHDIAEHNSGDRGTLSLGVPYSYVRFVLPALLERYVERFPHIDIDINTALSDDLVRRVQEGVLDVCFARYSVEDDTLERWLISQDQSYAVYSRPFTLDELPNIPYIEFNKNEATNMASRRWWHEHFDTPQNIRFHVTNADTCLSMIEHHLGYGIFPDNTYFRHDKRFYALPLSFKEGQQFSRKTWMVCRKAALKNPIISNFVDFVSEADIEELINS